MTIVTRGLTRTAIAGASTWQYCKIGTGSTAASVGQTDFVGSVFTKVVGVATQIDNVNTLVSIFSGSEGNTIDLIKEFAFGDTSTFTYMLLRSVSSTNTWTAFTKDSTVFALISAQITYST